MDRSRREAPLPEAMQGHWVEIDDPLSVLVVDGGKITCFGRRVEYDYKEVVHQDGALTVSLGIDDKVNADAFRRANVTDLVITPEGDFHAYNVKFAAQFVRANA